MGQTQINPRYLMVSAIAALVVALLTLAVHSLVVSAMGWLAFQVFAILSTIFITTPGGVASHSAIYPASPVAHKPIAKIYDSTAEPIIRDDAA